MSPHGVAAPAWRVRRRSLFALPPLFALALWVAVGDSWSAWRASQREDVTDAPATIATAFGGSRWQLQQLDAVADDPLQPVAAGVARVRVRVALTPGDEAAIKRLDRCTLALVDAHGRRWSPAGSRPREVRLPAQCNGSYDHRPEVGAPLVFEQWFLVPRDAAAEVEPRVVLDGRPPAQLRLRRD